jgi:glycosyltransferase involved in cell wall biosynthesis
MEENEKTILIIGSAHPFRGGGISTFNERLCRALNEAGNTTTIFNFTLQYPSIFFPGSNQYTDEPAPKGLLINNRVNSINPVNWFLVGNEIMKMKPDLVIFRYWIPFMAPCFGTIARRIRKNNYTRIVSIVDNIIPHEARFGDRQLTNYFVSSMDGFITMSKIVEDGLATFENKKPRINTPHPLYDNFGKAIPKHEALQKLGLDSRFKYLLFFGFIRDYKGLDLLLEALADERLQKLPIRLIVAGEFYSRPEPYYDLIKKNKLRERVHLFTQFIPNNEVPLYFSACDLVVQPYKNATQSGVTQVAMHFNKPIVTTNVGGLADMVSHEKAGYVVKPDAQEIAAAILDAFGEDRLAFFEKNILIEKQKFSWETMVESIMKLYHAIQK